MKDKLIEKYLLQHTSIQEIDVHVLQIHRKYFIVLRIPDLCNNMYSRRIYVVIEV